MSFRFIAQYLVLLPILAGVLVYRKAGIPYRFFLFFISFGLICDLIIGYENFSLSLRFFFFNLFSLVESLFYAWFIFTTSQIKIVRSICKVLFIVLPIAWLACHNTLFRTEEEYKTFSSWFDSGYALIYSILGGYVLLRLSEKNEYLYAMPLFWFLLMIFFDNFCTFFIQSFMETSFLKKIWFISNIVTIIDYIIITIGFILIGKLNPDRVNLKEQTGA